MLLDIHHYYVPTSFLDRVREDGDYYQAVVFRDEQSGLDAMAAGRTEPPNWRGPGRFPGVLDPGIFDLAVRLEEMDAMGLDTVALSVAPGLFYHFAEPALGQEVAELMNDAIHEVATGYPERFVPMGTVPLQDIPRAIGELERVVDKYGFTAIEIAGSVNGANYDEPQFDDFFRRVAELDVLIFVHPSASPGGERLRNYYTANSIGFPLETGICVASLVFGGTLERYPDLKVCLAHGGGIVPSLVGRWDHTWQVRAEARVSIERPPSEYVSRLYFDDLVHSDTVFEALIAVAGPDHIVVGTDYPYDMGERDPRAVLGRHALSAADRAAIEGATAARLLRVLP